MIRNRILVLVGSLVIDVQTKIDIQPPIEVIVSDGRASKGSLRRVGESKRIGLWPKLAAALFQKQKRAVGTHDNYILASIVVEVGKERARGVVEDPQAGRFGNIFECSISPVSIEPVGESRVLANVEIVKAVAVDVCDRDSIISGV